MDRVPTKTNPKLFDKLFAEIQQSLANNIAWLDHCFGKAERLVKIINGKKVYSPNVYVGGNEYELITPDAREFGNYSFFTMDDPQIVNYEVGLLNQIKCPFSLIVWLNVARLEAYDERNTESLKREVLRTLNGYTHPKYGSFVINKIYEKAENIFKGFTLDEIDNQFLMHPYCGWRFEGEAQVTDECDIIY